MISLATIGLLSAWSVTTVSGGVTYCCTGLRRDEGDRRYIRPGSSRPSLPNLKACSTTATTATNTLDSFHTLDDDTLAEVAPERLVVYHVQPDATSGKIINVLDSTEENTVYRFVKPGIRLSSDNFFWNHDCYFESLNPKTSRIASIYNGTVGKGGYVDVLTSDVDDDFFIANEDISLETCAVDDGPEESLIYKLLSFKFKLRNSFSTARLNSDNQSILLKPKEEENHVKPLNTGEKIFVSSKLSRDSYEFKLVEDQDITYKWIPSTGQLMSINRLDEQKQVAHIIKGENKSYLIEVNEIDMNPVIALTTSMIVINKI